MEAELHFRQPSTKSYDASASTITHVAHQKLLAIELHLPYLHICYNVAACFGN